MAPEFISTTIVLLSEGGQLRSLGSGYPTNLETHVPVQVG
jgi:hypothetical protein